MLGMLTGFTGDLLLAQVPAVLRADLFAVAALGGAAVVVIANLLQVLQACRHHEAQDCASLCSCWRRHGWQLPKATEPNGAGHECH